MQAVTREFVRSHVVPDITGLRRLGEQAGEDFGELLLGGGDVLAFVKERGEFGAVRPLEGEVKRVGIEHGLQALPGAARLGGGLGELGGWRLIWRWCQATKIASKS
ncbi:MAG TPA: hypothetical protein VIV12_25155 [Streptosporangiaceae bacterium]